MTDLEEKNAQPIHWTVKHWSNVMWHYRDERMCTVHGQTWQKLANFYYWFWKLSKKVCG